MVERREKIKWIYECGDRVTYKYLENNVEVTIMVSHNSEINDFINMLTDGHKHQIEITKIERPEYKVVEVKKDKWLIERIGDLALCYKTFIGKKATEKDLEICRCINETGARYTIASFDYNNKEYTYCLNSCGDKLNSKKIDWKAFGELVQKAYARLEG